MQCSVPCCRLGCKCSCSCAALQQLLPSSPVCSGSDSMFLMALSFLGSVTRPHGVSDTWNSAAAKQVLPVRCNQRPRVVRWSNTNRGWQLCVSICVCVHSSGLEPKAASVYQCACHFWQSNAAAAGRLCSTWDCHDWVMLSHHMQASYTFAHCQQQARSPSTNQPPSLLMRACFTLNPSSVRHCTTWQQHHHHQQHSSRHFKPGLGTPRQ